MESLSQLAPTRWDIFPHAHLTVTLRDANASRVPVAPGSVGGVNSKHSLAGKNQQLLVALSSGVLNCPQRITSTGRERGGGVTGAPDQGPESSSGTRGSSTITKCWFAL